MSLQNLKKRPLRIQSAGNRERHRLGFGARVLAGVDHFPVLRGQRRGQPHPARELQPDPGPAGADAVVLQQRVQPLHPVVGQHHEEQVRPDAVLLGVVFLTDPEGNFQIIPAVERVGFPNYSATAGESRGGGMDERSAVGGGLRDAGTLEEFVPILGGAGSVAAHGGALALERGGGAVAGGVGVVAAERRQGGPRLQPRGPLRGHASGGGDQRGGGQAGWRALAYRERVEGALDQQHGLGRGACGRQPEAAARLARAGGRAPFAFSCFGINRA